MMEFDPTLVHEWLRRSARRTPEKEVMISGVERWTYHHLEVCSDRLAQMLIGLGVHRQDRVAILAGNRPETVVGLYAALKAGCVFLVLDAHIKARRLAYILQDATPAVLIARTDQANTVTEALAERKGGPQIVWLPAKIQPDASADVLEVDWDSLLRESSDNQGGPCSPSARAVHPGIDIDLASLIYTSATTGNPKGVMCTHHNMISAARSIIQYLGNEPRDIILNALPLSFDYGLYQIIMAVMFGGTVVLESSFLYMSDILRRIADEHVTGLPVVPTMVAMLLKGCDLGAYDLTRLRYVTNTGAALPVRHIQCLRQVMPHVKIFSMFGLTECKRVGYLDPMELDTRPGSVGRAMPNCETLVVDKNGNEVSPGEVGELIIRGSNVMQGYWNDSEMTARVYRPGGYPASRWLHSGDCFCRDREGFLYFLGRRDDMIKTRGERVSPKEVESVICELDGVAESAVVGVPDNVLGSAIKAFVVRRDNDLDERALLAHCARRLESYMIPKYIEFVAALPKTAHGKTDKGALQRTAVPGRIEPIAPPHAGAIPATRNQGLAGAASGAWKENHHEK